MHHLIADKKAEIEAVCRRYRVARLEVFGSAARSTDFDPENSDADFLVEYQPPLLPGLAKRRLGLSADLKTVLGRQVDLTRKGTIDNPYLINSIEEDLEVVYEA